MPLQSRITIMVFDEIAQSLRRFRMADSAGAMNSLSLAIVQSEHQVVILVLDLINPKIGVPIRGLQGLVLVIYESYPGTFLFEACEQRYFASPSTTALSSYW